MALESDQEYGGEDDCEDNVLFLMMHQMLTRSPCTALLGGLSIFL